MEYRIFIPGALEIYKYGISSLTEWQWLSESLPYLLEHQILKKKAPEGLFHKTIKNGLLNILGGIFFDRLFGIRDNVICTNIITAYEQSNFLYHFLVGSGVKQERPLIDLLLGIDELEGIIQETPEKRQNSVFYRKNLQFILQDVFEQIENYYSKEICSLRELYSRNFAERVLHDRQLCEYISFAVSNKYVNGYPLFSEELRFVKAERIRWPSWVKPTLLARERNICANCGLDFSELKGEPQIDHIVPLDMGGSNDLVNLQVLCFNCNNKKRNHPELVKSSIPQYLNWHNRWGK